MRTLFVCFTFFFFSICNSVQAQENAGTSRIRIYLPHAEIKALRKAGVEFDHGFYNFEKGFFENDFPSSEVAKLKKLKYRFEVTVADVVRYTDSLNRVEDPLKYENDPVVVPNQYRNLRLNFSTTNNFEASIPTPPNFQLGSMGGFYNYTELRQELNEMLVNHSSLVTRLYIGLTLAGDSMYAYKISDNSAIDEAEPELLYTGMHHSREGMSMMNLIFFMRFLLDNYSSNPAIKEIVDNRELFFIPVVNLDGYKYNVTAANWSAGRRMRRKNLAETTTSGASTDGSGGDGVDINRNYPTYWGSAYSNGNTASSGTGNSDAYRGPSAGSEPETQNMMAFVNSRQFKVALNYHCAGNWWIRPEGPDPSVYSGIALPAAVVSNYNSIANLFNRYSCYVYGTANQTIYDVNGYSDDWFFSGAGHSPIYAFSPEIGSSSSDGFWCPQSRILPLAKEVLYANIQAAYTAGGYAELQDTSDVALTTTTGSFGYTVTRRGLTDAVTTVQIIPLNNIETVGGTQTINSISSFGGKVSGAISYTLPSGISAGTPVRFVWVVTCGGITIRDTVIKYFNPIVVFSDNMDNPSDFTGKWEASGTGGVWEYEVGSGLNGTASLTDSRAGNSANNANQIVRLELPLNLSGAIQASLSYMLQYSSENCQDRMQVEISTGGINGTYNPIATDHTMRENKGGLGNAFAVTGLSDGWVRELIDLTPYIGNNNIGLRFRFISNGTNGIAYERDGFKIDNLKVVKSTSYILPLSFGDIVATRENDQVTIRWKAVTDATFKRYVIQRSADGRLFETLQTFTDAAVNTFTDIQPLRGKNYYRVQLISHDEQITNSKIVNVIFERRTQFQAYPNPFTKALTIEISSTEEQNVTVALNSVTGQLLQTEIVRLKKGTTLHKMKSVSLSPQLCILTVKDAAGVVLHSQKIYKAD